MRLSPPLATIAIVAVMVALTAWLAPPVSTPAQTTVSVPTAVYERLVQQAQGRTDTAGQPMTVSRVIEELASRPQ